MYANQYPPGYGQQPQQGYGYAPQQPQQGNGNQQPKVGHLWLNPNGKPQVSFVLNVQDLYNMLQMAQQQGLAQVRFVTFMFPSKKNPGQFDGGILMSTSQRSPNEPTYPPQQYQQVYQQQQAVPPQPGYPAPGGMGYPAPNSTMAGYPSMQPVQMGVPQVSPVASQPVQQPQFQADWAAIQQQYTVPGGQQQQQQQPQQPQQQPQQQPAGQYPQQQPPAGFTGQPTYPDSGQYQQQAQVQTPQVNPLVPAPPATHQVIEGNPQMQPGVPPWQ